MSPWRSILPSGALAWTAFCLALSLSTAANADYIAPPLPTVIQKATGIVDVTPVAIDEQGHTRVQIHATWAGQAEPVIHGVGLSCMGGSVLNFGVSLGERYVILLEGAMMFEETTWYPVREQGTRLEVLVPDLSQNNGWQGRKSWTWRPMEEVRAEWIMLRKQGG